VEGETHFLLMERSLKEWCEERVWGNPPQRAYSSLVNEAPLKTEWRKSAQVQILQYAKPFGSVGKTVTNSVLAPRGLRGSAQDGMAKAAQVRILQHANRLAASVKLPLHLQLKWWSIALIRRG
jgi:hypothetical protein